MTVACTTWPGLTFWTPSVTTRSPACSPFLITSSMPDGDSGLYPPHLDLVLGIHHQDEGAGLVDLDGHLRHHQRRLRLVGFDHGRDQLPIDQQALGIGKTGPHFDRVGAGIDRHVHEVDPSGMGIAIALAELEVDREILGLAGAAAFLAEFQDLALADREDHVDRILAHDGGQCSARGAHEVAGRNQRSSDATGDRRTDVGIAQLQFSLLQFGLEPVEIAPRLVTGGRGVIQLRSGSNVLLHQRGLAFILDLGAVQACLGSLDRPARRGDPCLVGGLLDDEEKVAGLHILAFSEVPLFQEAVDPGAQVDAVQRRHPSGETDRRAKVLDLHLDHADSRRRRGRCLGRLFRRGIASRKAQEGGQGARNDKLAAGKGH